MRAKELIKLLKQNGWHEVSQKGKNTRTPFIYYY